MKLHNILLIAVLCWCLLLTYFGLLVNDFSRVTLNNRIENLEHTVDSLNQQQDTIYILHQYPKTINVELNKPIKIINQ